MKYNQIDLKINEKGLKDAVKRAKEKGIIMPTFAEMNDPSLISNDIKKKLSSIGLWSIDPLNLFRITWHNEPVSEGGGFGDVNYIEIPSELTGVNAKIIALVGKWFPTGAHKVGAAYGCLAPRLVTGQFDPTKQKAVWPSTGNYCRGGAYDSALLACESIAILPEGMSAERFEWLSSVAGETIKTPGTESNVKEIFDKCWELRKSGEDLMIFNQFDEFGNYLWHHEITGRAIETVLNKEMSEGDFFHGFISATGSGGTIAAGDYLKKVYPKSRIAAAEALQCPTIFMNGFGAHRIEGIGDKHIPWIHNAKNTDMVIAVDDEAPMNFIRLTNEPEGIKLLKDKGVSNALIEKLPWIGISGAANIIAAIKYAKYYECKSSDVIVTVLTDSMEMYESRINELNQEYGTFTEFQAHEANARYLDGLSIDYAKELNYYDRKAVHNLKYYTWVEQQGKTYEEIVAQWEDDEYWTEIPKQAKLLDEIITSFNKDVAL